MRGLTRLTFTPSLVGGGGPFNIIEFPLGRVVNDLLDLRVLFATSTVSATVMLLHDSEQKAVADMMTAWDKLPKHYRGSFYTVNRRNATVPIIPTQGQFDRVLILHPTGMDVLASAYVVELRHRTHKLFTTLESSDATGHAVATIFTPGDYVL